MGGMPGAGSFGLPEDVFQKIASDPEMLAAMQDPGFMEKLADIQQNPLNFSKYQNDPTVQRLMMKFSAMFAGEDEGEEPVEETGPVPSADDVD